MGISRPIFDANSILFKKFHRKVTTNIPLLELICNVNQDFIYKELCNLNSFKSTRIYNITVRFIKYKSERSSQTNNLPGESTNSKWDCTRGTETNQSETYI